MDKRKEMEIIAKLLLKGTLPDVVFYCMRGVREEVGRDRKEVERERRREDFVFGQAVFEVSPLASNTRNQNKEVSGMWGKCLAGFFTQSKAKQSKGND